jgi:uncharacterized damage-inducible protein DinB
MSLADALVPEFEQEMASTRKVLASIPDDKLTWRAHPKSNTIAWVASHLAEIVNWSVGLLQNDHWDVRPDGGEPVRTPVLESRDAILKKFDDNLAEAIPALKATSDEAFAQPWSLLDFKKPIFTMPRAVVFRSFILNHTIHHRGILCVYLRLNDIPVPGMYGPSGDEKS